MEAARPADPRAQGARGPLRDRVRALRRNRRRGGEGARGSRRARARGPVPRSRDDREGVQVMADRSDTIEYRVAIREAIAAEMERDETVVFFGEDVAIAGGVFAVTPGLHEQFGDRVIDTPISELAMSAGAFGAAVTGLRPIFEIMFADFLLLAMDSLVNQAAKYWYVSGEQAPCPLVVRSAMGAGGNFGAMHSQSPVPWLQGVPGLKVVAPATAGDARALLRQSIRDDNPVAFLEHKRLYSVKDPVAADAPETLPLGKAAVVREGSDV